MSVREGRGRWQWAEEDPTVLIVLTFLLVLMLSLPWPACGPARARGGSVSLVSWVGEHLAVSGGEQD